MSTIKTQIKSREIEITQFLHAIKTGDSEKKITGVFEVIPKHIEGTQMCEVQLPCKYNGKSVTIAVYE